MCHRDEMITYAVINAFPLSNCTVHYSVPFLLTEWRSGLPTCRQEPTRNDKNRQEVTRGDKKVLDAFTDIYNVMYYILHLFAPVRIPYIPTSPPVYGFFFFHS